MFPILATICPCNVKQIPEALITFLATLFKPILTALAFTAMTYAMPKQVVLHLWHTQQRSSDIYDQILLPPHQPFEYSVLMLCSGNSSLMDP